MCKHCLISLVATYFLIYALLYALGSAVNLWLYSLIITILLSVAIISCPAVNKEGWKCCHPAKPSKAAKKAVKKKK